MSIGVRMIRKIYIRMYTCAFNVCVNVNTCLAGCVYK